MGTSPPLSVRFRVLGPLEVTSADGTPVGLGGRRARELLGVLLLNPHRTVSASRLVESLWGEAATDGAHTTLRTYVGQVRRLLDAAGLPEALVTRDGGYALVVDPADVDAERFERLLDRGQEALALGNPDGARTTLSEALGLWRGAVLADLDGPDFAAAATAHLEERRADAWEALTECELALGRHRDVVLRLQELVAEHPFRERFAAQLMVALYRSGRQADALGVYAATRDRLAAELGLDPGPELAALESAVLRHDSDLGGEPSPVRAADPGPAPGPSPGPSPEPAPLPDAVLAALGRRPLVGRESAMARLEADWRTTTRGGAAVALVSGPAGIGKSRLAAEIARLAATDAAVVLVGRCEESSAPYHPVVSALQPVLGAAHHPGRQRTGRIVSLADVPEPLRRRLTATAAASSAGGDDEAERRALWRSVTWFLGALAAEDPVLVVIDDAERVDLASGLLLRKLALDLPPRVMVVVCYRDPPGSRHPPLGALLADPAVVEVAERVRPVALTEPEVGQLVRQLTEGRVDEDAVRRLHARTGGNPFYATELLRASGPGSFDADKIAAAVPVTVQEVLRPRLLGLPERTRELLGAAAVVGAQAALVLLSAVVGLTDDEVAAALEPAVVNGLLVPSGQSWAGAVAFAHELTREVVYAEIPVGRRERLHAAVAGVLLAGAPDPVPDTDVVTAAAHLRRAGAAADLREAARVSLRAARIAGRALAWEEAVQHAEAALELLRRTAATGELADAEVEVAVLRLRAGLDPARAVALLEDALRTVLATGDRAAAGTVHSRLGGALCLHHAVLDVPRALEHFEAAERMLPDPKRVFHLQRGRAQAAMFGLHTDLLADASRRAQELAHELSRPDLGVLGDWGSAWYAMDLGRVAEADTLLQRAWEAARDEGDAYLGWGPVNAAAIFATLFRLDPATGRAWCRRGMGQPRFGSFRQPHDTVVDQLAHALLMSGEVEQAREVVDGLAPDASSRRVLRFRDGDWEGAVREWSAALARDRAAGNRQDALVNARWLTEALLVLGEDRRAQEVAEEGLAVATTGPHVPSELWFRAELARTFALRTPDLAAEHVHRCRAILDRGEDWGGVHGHVLAAEAVVAAVGGRWEPGRAAHQEALHVLAGYRLPWHRAVTQRAWAEALAATGHHDEAAVAEAAAATTYDRIGAAARWREARATQGAGP